MKEFKQANTNAIAQLAAIETPITANQKMAEEYIKKNNEALKTLQDSVDKLEGTVSTLKATANTQSDNMEKLKTENLSANNKFKELDKVEKQQDEDKRKENLIIEGLKESKTNHPHQQVKELLAGIGVNITAES